MSRVQAIGDSNDGGGKLSSSPNSTVYGEGKLLAVDGSKGTGHGTGKHAAGAWETKARTKTVFCEGKPLSAEGDTDTCGHKRAGGRQTIFIWS